MLGIDRVRGERGLAALLPSARRRPPALLLAAGLLLAVACYLAGLDGPIVPGIGDESLYVQIARLTAASGRWLPLRAAGGILDTKPPLLFWTGIAATGGGRHFELWRLRLPVVGLTFATAALVGWLAARISRDRAAGALAALAFLGFHSTIQHGRPFLTNAGETLFLFAPLALALPRRRLGPGTAVAVGLSLALAALFKSFFLVLPGTVGLWAALARRDRHAPDAVRRRHLPVLAGAAAIGLAGFALWPLLDPRPDLILSQFVVGENAGKFSPGRFLGGLVSGPYPLWRIWLGDLANAGLWAPPVVALGVDAWRRRRDLSDEEGALWAYVLAFLAIYSLPTQRQENYLLPTCAAVAVLLALRWSALGDGWFRLPLALLGVAALAVPVLLHLMDAAPGGPSHPRWVGPAAAALGIASLVGAVRAGAGRALFPAAAVAVLGVITGVLAPFNARFPAAVAAPLAGRVVLAPDRFREAQELERFRLPGAELVSYRCTGTGAIACPPPPPAGAPALAQLDVGQPAPPGWVEVAELPALKSRHTPAQIAAIVGGDLGLLLSRLVLLRPAAGGGPVAPPPQAP